MFFACTFCNFVWYIRNLEIVFMVSRSSTEEGWILPQHMDILNRLIQTYTSCDSGDIHILCDMLAE